MSAVRASSYGVEYKYEVTQQNRSDLGAYKRRIQDVVEVSRIIVVENMGCPKCKISLQKYLGYAKPQHGAVAPGRLAWRQNCEFQIPTREASSGHPASTSTSNTRPTRERSPEM